MVKESLLVTPGKLIDALITTNVKLYFTMNALADKTISSEERVRVSDQVIALNTRRNKLVDEIDRGFLSWLKRESLYEIIELPKEYNKD